MESSCEKETLIQDDVSSPTEVMRTGQCGKCKKITVTKLCFAPDCGKIRCYSCVQTLCRKNTKEELRDEDGDLIVVCTKVSTFIFFVSLLYLFVLLSVTSFLCLAEVLRKSQDIVGRHQSPLD